MRLSSLTLSLILLAGISPVWAEAPEASRVVTVHGAQASYALPGGATSFVIRLPDRAPGRNLTFMNENAAAEGELSIAVSNQSLAADSPDWNSVEGKIRFRHKRLFTVSMVGVEGKYVRLAFHVKVPRSSEKSAETRTRRYKLARIASS